MNRLSLAVLAAAGLAVTVPAAAQMGQADPFGDATIARTDAEASTLKRFDTLDVDHDGSLSPAEMAAARPGMGPRQGDRPRRGGGMGPMADANGDGKVSREEFAAMQLRMFDRMDADHDGKLTKPERQAAMEEMRQRMMARMAGNMAAEMGGGNEGN